MMSHKEALELLGPNPLTQDQELASGVRDHLGEVARHIAFIVAFGHRDASQIFTAAYIASLLADDDEQHAGVVTWELANVIYLYVQVTGMEIHEAKRHDCDCSQDHSQDLAAYNAFFDAAVRLDRTAALAVMKARRTDPLEMLPPELAGQHQLAQVLLGLAGYIAHHGREHTDGPNG